MAAETVRSELIYSPPEPTHVVLTIAIKDAVLLKSFLSMTSSRSVKDLGFSDPVVIDINDVLFEVYRSLGNVV